MQNPDEDKIIAQQARIEQLKEQLAIAGRNCVDDFIAAGCLQSADYPDDLSALRAHDEKLRAVFQAGAASRDAEVAELVAALERMRVAGGSQEFHIAWELAKDVLTKVRKP